MSPERPPAVEPLAGRKVDRATPFVEPLAGAQLRPQTQGIRVRVGSGQLAQVEQGQLSPEPTHNYMLAVRRHGEAHGLAI